MHRNVPDASWRELFAAGEFFGYNISMFYFDYINGKKILKSDFINGSAEAFFTTRETVIKTKEPGMNGLVEENKNLICDFLKIKRENLVSPCQTHTSHIEITQARKSEYPDTDGLILNNIEQAVFLNFADCTPVILYDRKQNLGAVIHAGWRGTAERISEKAVRKLREDFNTKPENITALIGPAISLCCYNVGDEVFEKLKETVSDFENLYEIRNNEKFVDLKNINARQLNEAGVTEIDVCPYCTSCDNDLFFSYRKENATTNRHSAVLKLNTSALAESNNLC